MRGKAPHPSNYHGNQEVPHTNSKKEKRITIRLSPEEYDRMEGKANKAGLAVGTYVRAAALHHKITVVDGLQDCTAQLKAIGRNLNQLTTLANMGKLSAVHLDETVTALREIYERLAQLSSQEKR